MSAMALDLGTTSIKAALTDENGALCHFVVQDAPKISVGNGSYESNALDYAVAVENIVAQCLNQANQAGKKLPLGLCSQRSSLLIWECASGRPVTPLVSWQDNRGKICCEAMQDRDHEIHELTGLRLTPYYFAPKLSVLLQSNPQWRNRLMCGELMVGTLDSFLIWRWTDGRHHITDASMAARTLLMDIQQQCWSSKLCGYFGIPLNVLPVIRPSTGLRIELDNGLILQASVADQSAALIATLQEDQEEVLVNLGTGGFVLRYRTKENHKLPGYLRTLVYQDQAAKGHFADEGTVNSVGVSVAAYPVTDCRVENFARYGIFCLAEPSGIGTPYFRSDLDTVFSSSIDHLADNQIAELVLEALIFRITRILEDFNHVFPIQHVYLSGGLSELACLQQGIAQCVPYEVSYLKQKEASLQGTAALISGLRPDLRQKVNKIRYDSRVNLFSKQSHSNS